MTNVGERKDVRKAEKAARIATSKRANVIRMVMGSTEGREWVWDLLSRSHCFITTFNGDALQSAYNEGQRSTGLALLADIMLTCPDQYIQAMRESNERHTLDRIDAERDTPSERHGSEEPDGGDYRRTASTDDDGEDRAIERLEDDGSYDLARFIPVRGR